MTVHKIFLSTTEPFNYTDLIKIRQDDSESQTFEVEVSENGVLKDLTGYTIKMVSRPNNFLVQGLVTNQTDLKNGRFSYTIEEQFWQKLGVNNAWFSFEQNGSPKDSTTNFSYFVIQGDRQCVPQGNYIVEFEELRRKIEEQLAIITDDYDAIRERIDSLFDALANVDFYTKEEARQMLIKFMSGEDIEVTDTFDFNGKVMGSVAENPNIARRYVGSTIPPSPPNSNEYTTQAAYDAIKKFEGTLSTQSTNVGVNGSIPWHILSFAMVENYKRKYPFIFKGTDAENLASLKSKLIEIEPLGFAKGSGPSGNKISAQVYFEGNWIGNSTNTTANISKIGFNQLDPGIAKRYIGPDGFCHLVVFSEASNSTVSSIASVDYASVRGTIKLNIKDFVPTRQEFDTHIADTVKHITAAERTKWNAKQDVSTLSQNEVLWTGGLMMASAHTVTPSKALNQCENGWVLKWNKYTSGSGTTATHACLTYIPKNSGLLGTIAFPVALMQNYTTPVITKCLLYSNTVLTGHGANDLAPNNQAVLTEIRSY